AGAVLADHAVSRETGLVEEAMTRIQTSGAVAYGMAHLARAVDEGAVETLVVLADLLRGEDADQWQQVCEAVHDLGGTIVQCSRDHDAGAQLDGLGGAVALTRYRVD
ncbi:MAG: mRNA surveillance protein Pelota, partial [Candidatus Thermoplasmatota archaeon]|nr:mRNA surveillance protein Pelota [Candidatus Thermoplasmatota archaeon]